MYRANMKFFMRGGGSGASFTFCVAMVATGHDQSVYLPILTSVIGYWLPAPEFQHDVPAPPLGPNAV